MSLNPTGTVNYNWNYSHPEKDGYTLDFWGTVVSMQEVQAREFSVGGGAGRPRFWPSGNPVMNIRIGFATPDGSLKALTFQKAGKKQVSGEKPSLHMQLFNLTNGNMMELMGKTLHLWTWINNPNTGQAWGPGNPRLFGCEAPADAIAYTLNTPLPEEFKVPELLANDAASGGQVVQQGVVPQQIQTPTNIPQMNNGYPPVAQQQFAQPQQAAPQAMPPQPQQQAMPPQQQAVAGMDPVVANAMQAVGNPVSVYDEDIPY